MCLLVGSNLNKHKEGAVRFQKSKNGRGGEVQGHTHSRGVGEKAYRALTRSYNVYLCLCLFF